MDPGKMLKRRKPVRWPDSLDLPWAAAGAAGEPESASGCLPVLGVGQTVLQSREADSGESNQDHVEAYSDKAQNDSDMTLVEFVERRFIPEYVASKRPAGRAHFEAILKHVLKPAQVARVFRGIAENSHGKLKELPDWPYLDSHRLHEVNAESVQRLIAASLRQGYSTQTATHIRNVVRAIFSHAQNTSFYLGKNPAAVVILPAMLRKETPTLSLSQLKQLLPKMNYPERVVALFAILTDMNVAEICGLQWRYVNLANHRGRADGEWLPPMSIAVRKQRYRGQLGRVIEGRKRFISIQAILADILIDLRSRTQFTGPHHFVVVSGSGTPIHPENIAARRLKVLGRMLGMPWLSWSVFRRTRTVLRAEFGRQWNKHIQEVLSLAPLTNISQCLPASDTKE